jgi:hypothetical protein
MPRDEREHEGVRDDGQRRKGMEQLQDFVAPRQLTECKLADDERMAHHLAVLEPPHQLAIRPAKMVDPDGGVDERHRGRAGRLRLGARARLSDPPRAARRAALRSAISARSPAWTTAVFSDIPVSRFALSTSASSRIMVVRMHIIIAEGYA